MTFVSRDEAMKMFGFPNGETGRRKFAEALRAGKIPANIRDEARANQRKWCYILERIQEALSPGEKKEVKYYNQYQIMKKLNINLTQLRAACATGTEVRMDEGLYNKGKPAFFLVSPPTPPASLPITPAVSVGKNARNDWGSADPSGLLLPLFACWLGLEKIPSILECEVFRVSDWLTTPAERFRGKSVVFMPQMVYARQALHEMAKSLGFRVYAYNRVLFCARSKEAAQEYAEENIPSNSRMTVIEVA